MYMLEHELPCAVWCLDQIKTPPTQFSNGCRYVDSLATLLTTSLESHIWYNVLAGSTSLDFLLIIMWSATNTVDVSSPFRVVWMSSKVGRSVGSYFQHDCINSYLWTYINHSNGTRHFHRATYSSLLHVLGWSIRLLAWRCASRSSFFCIDGYGELPNVTIS